MGLSGLPVSAGWAQVGSRGECGPAGSWQPVGSAQPGATVLLKGSSASQLVCSEPPFPRLCKNLPPTSRGLSSSGIRKPCTVVIASWRMVSPPL